MNRDSVAESSSPPLPHILTVGVTGHREGNAAFDANRAEIATALTRILTTLEQSEASDRLPENRLVTNLAHGTDLLAAEIGVERGWKVFAPLPFGHALNLAVNTPGLDPKETAKVAAGNAPSKRQARQKWERLHTLSKQISCFELAEQDEYLLEKLEKSAQAGRDSLAVRDLGLLLAERSSAASAVTIEQSDILVAVWDGSASNQSGGTRDTISKALTAEVPVLWIDARDPVCARLLRDPGDLLIAHKGTLLDDFDAASAALIEPVRAGWEAMEHAERQFHAENWRPRSRRRFHAYRRIEALFSGDGSRFGSLVQTYERPEDAADGSARSVMEALETLPGADPRFLETIRRQLLPRFAMADGLSTYFSDAYRGGMVASFLLSAAAIIGGVAYLPFVGAEWKWPFALFEFIMLIAIVAITWAGIRGNWHQRWFQKRRVAEYLRHAPIILSLGSTRPIGRWPKSRDAQWPERDARLLFLVPGLPRMYLTRDYLRGHLEKILLPYLVSQRDYHRQKSTRLERVHHNLDRMSEFLFLLAILSVGGYLLLKLLAGAGIIDSSLPYDLSKIFTFLGVAFPTLGASLAGIRYFGDFERFAAISDISTVKLDRLRLRAEQLLRVDDCDLCYQDLVDLAHATSDVVIEEIEGWQSIFGTKKMAVPV